MLLLAGCKEKGSFSNVEIGESWLCRLVFEDESFKDYAVTADVLYAGRLAQEAQAAARARKTLLRALGVALAFLIVAGLVAGSIYLLNKKGDGS